MKNSVLFGALAALGLLVGSTAARAQGAISNGATYRMTHYGVPADNSAVQYGVPTGSPLCLDVDRNLTTAGATLGQWGENANDGQQFVFELQSDGSYKLRHKGTVMYVQTVGLSKAVNTRIEQNVLVTSNDDAQRWLITDPNNNGRYKFTLKNSANAQGVLQVLEIGFASAAPGAPVNLYDDNGFEQAQRWVLTRTVLATKNAAGEVLWLQAYPNPAARGQALRLRVEAQRPGAATIEVIDALGRPVYRQSASLVAGGNPVELTNAALAPGLYLVRMTQSGFVQQTRFVQQ
ncbi:hypothetical protein GCM10022409_48730 [Hymenobacter glaciei]|uniref:Ricin B lectin domain-containing protein n=1 Tax=Hymenobacter glaciei TaxID=877209 RepID=A0ABP7UYN2_9BACT